MFLLFEGFQSQNIIWFTFPMKHSDLLMAKITPNVKNSHRLGMLGI